MKKKTFEEYQATAMLLGMRYWDASHVFVIPRPKQFFDADTLEPLTKEERLERFTRFMDNVRRSYESAKNKDT